MAHRCHQQDMNLYNFPSRAQLPELISLLVPCALFLSHRCRTLNLALPVCPTSVSVTSCLFPASSVGLSCCVPKPGLPSSSDLTSLLTHLSLQGHKARLPEHNAQTPLTPSWSHTQTAAALGGSASRAELLPAGTPQAEWVFFRNRVKQSCETTFVSLQTL